MKKKWLALLFALIMGLTIGVSQASAEIMISPGTIGDVLLFSLYDVREDPNFRTESWDNFLVIENTSGNWTAVTLRFRAYKKSIEVWDHVILLSPYDMFWADLLRTPGGGVTIWSNDENTLRNSGLLYEIPPGFRMWEDTFKTDLMVACGFDDDLAETEMGEVEVIGLFSLESPGGEDTHNLAEVVRDVYQDNYEALMGYNVVNVYDVQYAGYYEFDPIGDGDNPPFIDECRQAPQPNTDTWWNPGWERYIDAEVWINECEAPQGINCAFDGLCDGTTRMLIDCPNVLTGAFEMGDVGNGRYELQNFTVLQDFRTDQVDQQGVPWAAGRTGELNGFHRDRYGSGEIVFPPTVMSTDINEATYTGFPADGIFTPVANTNIPAYYLNESWSSQQSAGLRDGDNVMALNSPLCPPFNNIWSLDDVENALAKTSVWFHYFDDFLYDITGFGYITDLSVSFPTKHYHWFFELWPWWQVPYPDEQPSTYADYIIQYREKIADVFDFAFDNGRIVADSAIWNDNEDLYDPPPSSGPSPITHENVVIPHEVNYIRVGEPGLLYIDPALGFDIGHFRIDNIRTTNGLRGLGFGPGDHPIYRPNTAVDYSIYPVGAVTFLNYAAVSPGVPLPGGLVRSTLSNWHYVWAAIHPWEGWDD